MDREFGSGRGSGKITLYFEKLPVSLKLFKARHEEKVELNQFSEKGNPVGYSKFDKITGEKVEKVVRGKKVGNSVVLLSDEEVNLTKMKKNEEIKELSVEDLENPRIEEIKEIYFAKPENNTLFSLIASGLKGKQVRFKLVDGNQEREAVLQYLNDVVKIYLKFYKEEVISDDVAKIKTVEINDEQKILVATLLANLHNDIKLEKNRQQILEELLARKLRGEVIQVEEVKKEKEESDITKLLTMSVSSAKKKKEEVKV